jgi:hypothetical protein
MVVGAERLTRVLHLIHRATVTLTGIYLERPDGECNK